MAAVLQEAPIFMQANGISNVARNGSLSSFSPRGAHAFRAFPLSRPWPRFAPSRGTVFLRKAVVDDDGSIGPSTVLPSGEWPENFSILNFEDFSKHYESVLFKEELNSKVKEVLSSPPITLTPDKTVSDAAILMLKRKIHRIPIVNKSREVVGKGKLIWPAFKVKRSQRWCLDVLLPAVFSFPVLLFPKCAHAEVFSQHINPIYGDLGAGSEVSVQVLYLAALLGLVGVASYFVVKQVLNRRDLESAARELQDRVRTGEAMPVEYFELGAVMLRKKFYVLASKYLEQAIAKWDGDQQDLAQVHNALGYSYVNDEQIDRGIAEYQKAVKLQPGYVIAWNNLGSAFEKKKNYPKALEAYEKALLFDPNNAVAKEYRDDLKKRVDRLEGVPVKYD